MPNSNPIAQAFDALIDQWVSFADDQKARLLLWQATADESPLVDLLIGRESDAELAQTPDIFLQTPVSFRSDQGHGFALVHELGDRYEQAVSSFDDPQRAARWHLPRIDARGSDISAWVSVLSSFREHHAVDNPDALLVVWLEPTEVSSFHAYTLWLQRLVHELPRELRVIVLDDLARPALSTLAQIEPERVRATACALGIPTALEAVARDAGTAMPGDQLRLLQTQLGVAVAEGELSRVEALAGAATELSLAQGWPQLAAGVQMMLAAGRTKNERPVEALAAYEQAEQHARALEARDQAAPAPTVPDQPGVNLGRQLRLHAMLGRGAVLLTLKQYQLAADTYLAVAALAQALGDLRAELDGYRLTALCYGLLPQVDKAWHMGMHGLQFALGMDAETRKSSTLPYLADQLVRITTSERSYGSYRQPLEDQLQVALGPDWRDQLAQTHAV